MTLVAGDFAYVRQLVFERSAIVLGEDKQYLINSRLQPLARELGLDDSNAVVARLQRTKDRSLESKVIEAMTTNETLWFRDVHPFSALRNTILPEIVARRSSSRCISVWSAACSSGQELYSIGMTIADQFPELRSWRLKLIGTDISSEMVDRATKGSYSTLEVNRGLPASMLVRHFDHVDNHFTVKPEIRRGISFQQMNLVGGWAPLPRFDLVCIRNVLIYFDLPTRTRVLAQVARTMDPGGYLMIGSAESMVGVSDEFEMETADGATFYRLKGRS